MQFYLLGIIVVIGLLRILGGLLGVIMGLVISPKIPQMTAISDNT
jgi:hypothetical protein